MSRKLIPAVLFLVSAFALSAAADETANDAAWARDRARITSTANSLTCQQRWDIWWQWVKKGNPEARGALQAGGYRALHMVRPGFLASRDAVRDGIIATIYTLDVQDDNPVTEKNRAYWMDTLKKMDVTGVGDFFSCMERFSSDECVPILIQNDIIPTYDRFIEEIDSAISVGAKPQCTEAQGTAAPPAGTKRGLSYND